MTFSVLSVGLYVTESALSDYSDIGFGERMDIKEKINTASDINWGDVANEHDLEQDEWSLVSDKESSTIFEAHSFVSQCLL